MIAIFGAGPAGSSAAIAARRCGVPVRLLERDRSAAFKAGESLAPVARAWLRRLGVWEQFSGDGHRTCVGNASAWGSDTLERTDFLFGVHGPGWHLDRRRFDDRLRQTAIEAGAVWADDPGDADWCIDCTGRASQVARQRGAKRLVQDSLLSHVALLEAGDDEAFTLVEARPDGWWYTAVIPGGRRVVAYQTEAGSESDGLARSRNGFQALLAETSHVRERGLGEWVSGPAVQPAGTSRLDRFAGPGWVAAGDAAYALDPLSSHGIVHAMQSGWAAGTAVAAQLQGDGSAMSSYENQLDQEFHTYLELRTSYYLLEQRWQENSFWQRNRFAFGEDKW